MPNIIIELCLFISRFSGGFLCPKIGVLVFHLEFSCNQLAILTRCSSDSQAARYIFLKNSELVFRIYSVFSGSLCGSMSNFDGLFEFLSNRLQTLEQS